MVGEVESAVTLVKSGKLAFVDLAGNLDLDLDLSLPYVALQ